MRPLTRLRRAVVAFFRSEHEEAGLRGALDDASALFRDAPEARALQVKANRRLRAFMDEALPKSPAETRAFAADFVFTTMAAVAEKITTQPRSRAEIETWADTYADLLGAFLRRQRRDACR